MGTGNSWLTVFSGLEVIGLASLCAIYIPSAHPCSEVQYVGLLSSFGVNVVLRRNAILET